jgi:hypothetical protein
MTRDLSFGDGNAKLQGMARSEQGIVSAWRLV